MIHWLALAALPALIPDGTRLHEGASCYTIRSGEQAIGLAYQSIAAGPGDTLRIVVHQRVGGGKFDMRDEFVVRRSDLRPVSLRNVRNGEPHVSLDYGADRVTGWKVGKDGKRSAVSVALPGPVWDGNLWGLTFAALPLGPGVRFELPIYQYDSGLGAFGGTVTGTERAPVAGGAVDSWLVDAGVSAERRTTYVISRDGREIGYRAGKMSQMLGGDCSALAAAAGERG